MGASRFYVVWRGRRPGVYDSWETCAQQVQGYSDALYRGYPTRELAERAFRLGPEAVHLPLWQLAEPGPQTPALAVDAAASQPRGPVQYRGVVFEASGKVQEVFRGSLDQATVPVGEFLALLRGLQWLEQQGQRMPVYVDAQTAWHWFQRGGPKPKVLQRLGPQARQEMESLLAWWRAHPGHWDVRLWPTSQWGENPADFGHK